MGSLRTLRSQIWKDLLIWYRRPVVIVATVASPLAYIFVIFFVSFTIGRNPVAVVVDDPGPQASRLAEVIQHSEQFIAHRMTLSEANAALQRMDVEAIITIPRTFGNALTSHSATVTIRVNNVNADEADDLRRSLPAAIATFYQATPQNPLPIDIAEQDVHATDFTLGQFEFIPIVVFIVTVAGVMCSGLIATQEWERGTITELLLAPVSRWVIVSAKVLAGWAQTMVMAAVVVAVGTAAGFLSITPVAILPCVTVLLLVGLASTGLGMAFGVTFGRIGPLYAIGIQVAVVMFFLSGGMSVIGFLPEPIQRASRFVPTYYAVHALDREILYTNTTGVVRDMFIVGGFAAAMIVVTVAVFRRRTL